MSKSNIFTLCKKYTLDPFWINIFSECEQGNFPKFVNVIDRQVYVNDVNIGKIPSKPPEAFLFMMDVFTNHINITNNTKIVLEDSDYNIDCEWKKITPKGLKEQFINNYIVKLSDKYDLNEKEIKKLTCTIKLGFIFHSITDNDVVYNNGKISKITGLYFDPDKRVFLIPKGVNTSNKSDKTVKTSKLHTMYNKFAKENIIRETKINKISKI